ncbi:MAG: YitT family protein [Eubacterium sp.]
MKHFRNEAYGYIKDMFAQHHMIKRVVLSFVSIIVMGFGISLFSVSGFGVDPFTSMNMNVASTLGIGFGTYQLIVNAAILLYVIIVAHRGLVGVGTVFNMVGCGYACEFFQSVIQPVVEEHYTLAIRIPLLIAGIITLCFACSLFFTANIGVGPYDALGFMLSRGVKLPHKWVRIITDITVILIGLVVSGGLTALMKGDFSAIRNIGIGTIITALCMGPLINAFNKYVSSKIFNVDYEKISKDVAFFMIKGAMLKNIVPRQAVPSNINPSLTAFKAVNKVDKI